MCKTIKELISEEIALKLSVGVVKHSRIVGAAIVAMMAEKIAVDHEKNVEKYLEKRK